MSSSLVKPFLASASSCEDLGLREVWAEGSMCELGIQTRMAGQEKTRLTEGAGRTFGCDGWEEMAQLSRVSEILGSCCTSSEP